ncbi:hypothetical protein D3C85_1433680 [compost metagenome]
MILMAFAFALIVLGVLTRRYRDKLTNVILIFGFGNSVVNTVNTNSGSESEKGGGVAGFVNILSVLVTLAGVIVGVLALMKG